MNLFLFNPVRSIGLFSLDLRKRVVVDSQQRQVQVVRLNRLWGTHLSRHGENGVLVPESTNL